VLEAPPLISMPAEQAPLTSEPPLSDATPLTSEPPLTAAERPLTAEPAGAQPRDV
jgi:hypothetical protein